MGYLKDEPMTDFDDQSPLYKPPKRSNEVLSHNHHAPVVSRNRLAPALVSITGHGMTWLTYYLFYVQPGVDRKAFMRWLVNLVPAAPVLPLHLFAILAINIPHFACVGFYHILYYLEWPIFEQYRIDKERPWGWHHPDPVERDRYRRFVRNGVQWFLRKRAEEVLFVLSLMAFQLARGRLSTASEVEDLISSTPEWQESAYQLYVGCLMWDAIYYVVHRAAHQIPFLYRYHKPHHEAVQPTASHGVWGDDRDGILGVLLPVLAPAFIFRMHYWTFICWLQIHGT